MVWTPSVAVRVPFLGNACEDPGCKVELFFHQDSKSRLMICRIYRLAEHHLLSP